MLHGTYDIGDLAFNPNNHTVKLSSFQYAPLFTLIRLFVIILGYVAFFCIVMAVQGMLIDTEKVKIPSSEKLYELDPYLKDHDKELRRR